MRTKFESENAYFFKKDSRSTALSYKKKKHSYITLRSVHHHTNKRAPHILHCHHLGEELKASRRKLRRCHQRCAMPKPQPVASPSGYPDSSTMGLSPSSRTDTIVDPSAPEVHQQNTPVAAPMNTTDPDHSAWGPRLSHHLTLCQALRYLKLQREHHLHPVVTELTTAPCSLAQVLQHP